MKPVLLAALALLVVFAPLSSQAATKADWASTIKRVEPSVVSIVINAPRAFDTERNFTGQATGFVVDAQRGIILTNRHVVRPGPVVATAIFKDHEEIPLTPIYRDPVHDFGFYHYDPSKLEYIQPKALKLAPDEARVGEDIRLIGNDAGEQYSILAGTLARLDRNAPRYGSSSYNDFNTFYYQADSGTSGGSSGSPIFNIHGHVVALNAGGGTHSSSSFFLPLDRVVPALQAIRQGAKPDRGTIETVFLHRPYNQLARFGLGAKTERRARHRSPHASGLLVVNQVLPQGPADGELRAGDILLSIDGSAVTGFAALGRALDRHVGNQVALKLSRGGQKKTVKLHVDNLYAITPSAYLQYSGAVFNNLSYEVARNMDRPVSGVFVADAGFAFGNAGIGRGAVITRLNNAPTPNLKALSKQIGKTRRGSYVSARYFSSRDSDQPHTTLVRLDSGWFPARFCRRDADGLWPCHPLPKQKQAKPPKPRTATYPHYRDPRKNALAPSLVFVRFDMPYRIEGVQAAHFIGTGLVVDAQKGLVIVDRNTVPVSLGRIRLTFAGSITIPAHVAYIAPLHNLAVLSYDPDLLGDTPVESARFGNGNLRAGDHVFVAGFNDNHRLVSQATVVAGKKPLNLPLSNTLRFRDSNLSTVRVTDAPSGVEGVLADARGRVVALWSSFAWRKGRKLHQTLMGIPLWLVSSVVSRVEQSAHPTVRALGAEFRMLPLSWARRAGLPDQWVERLSTNDNPDRQVLALVRLGAGNAADEKLKAGDLLLAIDGHPLHDFQQLHALSQSATVELTLLRNQDVIQVDLPTRQLESGALHRVLLWGGAILQRPPRALATQRHQPRKGVWVAYFNYGSPASRYGLRPGLRIVGVNGKPTPNISAFLNVVRATRADYRALRLRTVGANGRAGLVAMKLQPHYWPTYELVRKKKHWVRSGP